MPVQTMTERDLERGTLLRSPAKVNLYLRVGPLRQDGFHTLVSLFCSLSLCDEMLLSRGRSPGVSLTCDRSDVPCDDRNLVVKAGKLLWPLARRPVPVHFELRKKIPAGGGLGGGSSNAAVALMGLTRLWDCDVNDEGLHGLAATLGSDVPFFLHLPGAVCRGRGELATPVERPSARGILLLFPEIAMPTPLVYRKFDELGLGTNLSSVETSLPHTDVPARELLDLLVNDLEAPAFAISRELSGIRDCAQRDLGRPVRMSGSGSTLFTLYDSVAEAEKAALHCTKSSIRASASELGYLPEGWPSAAR